MTKPIRQDLNKEFGQMADVLDPDKRRQMDEPVYEELHKVSFIPLDRTLAQQLNDQLSAFLGESL